MSGDKNHNFGVKETTDILEKRHDVQDYAQKMVQGVKGIS